MKFFVYILQSTPTGRHYTGHCENVENRLIPHNKGKVRATKFGIPWTIIHTEEYKTRQDAYRREMQIKGYRGGEAFKRLIKR